MRDIMFKLYCADGFKLGIFNTVEILRLNCAVTEKKTDKKTMNLTS